jgi:diguanylate cyclase (GGDEF)-like protein
MPKQIKRSFIKEGFILLLIFWIISFLLIFYNYCTNIDRQINLEIELMKSQSELITRTVRHEVHQAIGDLSWYATNKSLNGGSYSDVSHLPQKSLSNMLDYKQKYVSLIVFDLDGRLLKRVDNRNHPVLIAGAPDHLSKNKLDLLSGRGDGQILVEFRESGEVGLYSPSSDAKSIIYISLQLEDFYDLKESVEQSFNYHVNVVTAQSPLFESIVGIDQQTCDLENCTGMHTLSGSEQEIYRKSNGIIVWSCLPCTESLPYGVEKLIWIDQSGHQLETILAVSILSGAPLEALKLNSQNEMKGILINVLLIQSVAAMVLGYVYHKYKAAQYALKVQATRDGLTGFLNRWAGIELLINHMALADRNKQPLTIAFIDIDKLKSVNDQFGHDDGDRLIMLVAEALKKFVREADSHVRIGGDEFFLILPNCDSERANDILNRALKWIDEVNKSKQFRWKADFSYGLSKYKPGSQMTPDELIHQADKNMYLHKRSKRAYKE